MWPYLKPGASKVLRSHKCWLTSKHSSLSVRPEGLSEHSILEVPPVLWFCFRGCDIRQQFFSSWFQHNCKANMALQLAGDAPEASLLIILVICLMVAPVQVGNALGTTFVSSLQGEAHVQLQHFLLANRMHPIPLDLSPAGREEEHRLASPPGTAAAPHTGLQVPNQPHCASP